MNSSGNKFIYYALLVLIVGFSANYYLPCFYSFFNSDQAIHVLMTKDFQLPRDYYYWGQNRLGSLLPMVSYIIYKIIHVHPVYICSVVQYLFILLPFLLIARYIKNNWLRLAFLCVLFLPVNSYNALLYVGHPYSQQLFCATLFILSFLKADQLLTRAVPKNITTRHLIYISLYLLGSVFFFVLGIWVSEFDAILALIPFIYVVRHFKKYATAFTRLQALLVSIILLLALANGYKWYQYTKYVSVEDAQYNNPFILDSDSITKEYEFMLQKAKAIFDYSRPQLIYENTIYLFFFLVIAFLVYKRKQIKAAGFNAMSLALIITSVVSSVVLFFAFWNFRSEFCPRYYIPVYIMLALATILYFDKLKDSFLKPVFFVILLIYGSIYTYQTVIKFKAPSPFEQYSDFSTLPKGTLIADYWESYLIQSVAINNLQSINFENQVVRVISWKEEPLSASRFYFLNNQQAKEHGLKDTIRQFTIPFVFTGKKYLLRSGEVLEYKKVQQ